MVTALALLLAAGPADDLIERCAGAAEKAEPLERAGRFTAAIPLLKVCAADECPKVVREHCRTLRADLETRVPTVQLRVEPPVEGVTATLDSEPLVLSSEPLLLDPGVHHLAIVAPTFEPATLELIVRSGEKLRPVVVTLHAPAVVATVPEVARPSVIPPLVSTLLVAAGVGVFTGLGLAARGDVVALRNGCAPYCSAARVSSARLEANVADVALLVGALAAIASIWLWARFATF